MTARFYNAKEDICEEVDARALPGRKSSGSNCALAVKVHDGLVDIPCQLPCPAHSLWRAQDMEVVVESQILQVDGL